MFLKRKPRITEDIYGRLMTSFGRVVEADRFVSEPAGALSDRVIAEEPALAGEIDARMYRGSAAYHLKLLAGAWVLSNDGGVPRKTAEVFEEAVAWKFGPLVKGSGKLAHRLSDLARGDAERDTRSDA
ncbi:hypothetical protein AYO38_08375 [bacterium SCGC AG-212-C10]|nr:hypothetical protein AYO38_08375 [bacterium SCGC AG-212-C10]